MALILREAESGGRIDRNTVIWAVLEPLIGITLLTVVFMIALPAPPLGTSFALFYASGLLPLTMFQDVTQKMTVSIRFSRPLLGFANIGFTDLIISRGTLALLTQTIVMTVMIGGLSTFLRDPQIFRVLQLGAALLALAVLSLGFGVLGCWLSVEIPVWPRVWAALLRPLIIISGVFFLVDDIGDPYRDWALWNPLAHVISTFRAGIYPSYEGELASTRYVLGVGLSCMAIGLLGLKARRNQLADALT